jgi:hypothetical protein
VAGNKLLNDLLTTIHLCINKIRPFMKAFFLRSSLKLLTLLKLVQSEGEFKVVKNLNLLIS